MPTDRVLSDQETHRLLMDVIRRPGKNKLLVCTKTDVMPLNTAAKDVSLKIADRIEHEKLEHIYKKKKAENLRLSKEAKTAHGNELIAIEQAQDDHQKELRLWEALLLHSLVKMRKEKITTAIAKKYGPLSDNARTLRVCHVSSRHYEMHLDGYTAQEVPLPLEATGIPDLRTFLSSITAGEKLEVLEYHCSGNLRSAISSLDGWSHRSALAQRDEIRKLVEKPSNVFPPFLIVHLP